jgi:DNA-binding NarL/FixJ family response regulator
MSPSQGEPVSSWSCRRCCRALRKRVMSQEIRILLVDDHGLFRESLSRLLQAEPDFRIAATCASATEALAVVDQQQIDVVLLDYDLGDEQGSAFLEEARRRRFPGHILMVTAGMSDAGTLRALESGAAGIFLKHSPPAQLVEAIYKVTGGEMWLDSRAIRSLVAGATGKSDEQRTSQPLTERERAVLKGVFEGLTNKEIGAKLQTSEGTIKAVMQQLFDKTGVRTRSQLVRIALERLAEDWRPGEPEG